MRTRQVKWEYALFLLMLVTAFLLVPQQSQAQQIQIQISSSSGAPGTTVPIDVSFFDPGPEFIPISGIQVDIATDFELTPVPPFIPEPQVMAGFGISLLRRFAIPLDSLGRTLGETLASAIHAAKVVLGRGKILRPISV